jgi:hypothetical protein
MYLDAIQFKVSDGAHVRNKAIYLAIGVTLSGLKEVLGLWIAQTEGAKFWLQVVTELKNRGVSAPNQRDCARHNCHYDKYKQHPACFGIHLPNACECEHRSSFVSLLFQARRLES